MDKIRSALEEAIRPQLDAKLRVFYILIFIKT